MPTRQQPIEVEFACESCGAMINNCYKAFEFIEPETKKQIKICHICFFKKYISCGRCLKIMLQSGDNHNSVEVICPECLTLAKTCPHCDKRIFDNLVPIHSLAGVVEEVCPNCASSYHECSDCGTHWIERDIKINVRVSQRVKNLCHKCHSQYVECVNCRQLVAQRPEELGLYYFVVAQGPQTGQIYCAACWRGFFGSDIHGYSHKPHFVFFEAPGEATTVQHFGVEFEINCNSNKAPAVLQRMNGDYKTHVYLKRDGSLHSGGFEIVTMPHSFKAQKMLWKEYFNNPVTGITAYRSGECGFHVHIERKHLTESHIRKMLVFVNSPENYPVISKIAQRGSCRYSRIEDKKLTDQLSLDRYEALNLSNETTVELRIFRASYRLDRVLKNLEFSKALVDFTLETGYRDLTTTKFQEWIDKQQKLFPYLFGYLHNTAPVDTEEI